MLFGDVERRVYKPTTCNQVMLLSNFKMKNILEKVFDNHLDVLNSVQVLAKEQGFAVTTTSSTPGRHIYLKCVHGGQYKNCHGVTEETRKLKRSTMRDGCPWTLYASSSKKHAGKFIVRKISEMEEHTHSLVTDATVYHQHRKPDSKTAICIQSMTRNGIKPSQIYNEIRGDDGRPLMKMRDIYSFRGRLFKISRNSPVPDLLDFLEDRGYNVRYSLNGNDELKALFIFHPEVLQKAIRFSEVVLIDATYKTNIHKMPLVNIVGVSNLGGIRLRSFLIAQALMTEETTVSYKWVTEQMRTEIWRHKAPGLFVTDNEQALRNALTNDFPTSSQILCAWHIEKNFVKHAQGCFEKDSEDEVTFLKSVKGMIWQRELDNFYEAEQSFRAIVENTPKKTSLNEYLDEYGSISLPFDSVKGKQNLCFILGS